jgi:hypothetical protein
LESPALEITGKEFTAPTMRTLRAAMLKESDADLIGSILVWLRTASALVV